ncbi:hypothetical protein LTR09_009423 [Extremus antarcticus]|uniref:Uncharacterized protein n=1 Tax=Extremus antarcticus TaxID=702011 RepID=A0AAJ0DG41_9PEZI|nr:hypothetical protein LTR09_009423 [Extremus antarcticus]
MPAYSLVVHMYAKKESVDKLKAKLQEASQVYSKDKECLSWYHLENPYWQTFDKYVIPLLEKDMDLHRYNELDTSKEVKVDQDPKLWEAIAKHQSH